MGKADKILEKVMSGNSDANIRFDDVCILLSRLGFTVRKRGSHVIFQKGAAYINLQDRQGMVKEYQVRQIRETLQKENP